MERGMVDNGAMALSQPLLIRVSFFRIVTRKRVYSCFFIFALQ